MTETTVKAKTYKEFADKVLRLLKTKEKFVSLTFLKSAGNTAVFTNEEGNRYYFFWERVTSE